METIDFTEEEQEYAETRQEIIDQISVWLDKEEWELLMNGTGE